MNQGSNRSLRSSQRSATRWIRDYTRHCSLIYHSLPDCVLGPRPGIQYYVLLCDSNRHRIRILETRERSCCPRNQRQLQWRWTPKGLHGILIQLQQLPSLPSLECGLRQTRVPGVRARFRFFPSSLSSVYARPRALALVCIPHAEHVCI